jgi:uncharacterized protein YbaA (DUF1428 family)
MIAIHESVHWTTVAVPPEDLEQFKTMVARACNVWPDASAEIKSFHDRLIHGYELQKYKDMPK